MTRLEFHVSNGSFAGKTDIYCGAEDIKEIGENLLNFPRKVGDEYCFEYGSEMPEDNFYRFFLMRVYTFNAQGHCALQFKINLNEEEPLEGQSTFSIQAESQAISRLGNIFLKFSELKHKEFHWAYNHDEMFTEHQAYTLVETPRF